MGGGTEMSLACRYRVASRDPKTKIGLPEVMLGIIPGWGGTARLPRLIGATDALPLMLTGKAVSAEAARSLGLVDVLSSPELLVDSAKELIRHRRTRPFVQRAKVWATNIWPVRQILAPIVRKQTAAKVRPDQYPAPFALIEVWRRGGSSITQRLKLEARAVAKLAQTATCRNLIRVYFLQERLKGLGSGADAAIRHVHVIGAGVMGGDIAAWCALRGFDVTLQDREMKFIQPALDRAQELFGKRLKTPERIQPVAARLKADVDGKGIGDADLVIEAIFENLQAKRDLFAKLEAAAKPDALLASNTSSLKLADIARRRFRVSSACTISIRLRRCRWSRSCARIGSMRPTKNVRSRSARRSTNCRCRSRARRVFSSIASSCPICSRRCACSRKACRGRCSTRRQRSSACRWGRSNWPTRSGSTCARRSARKSANSSVWKSRKVSTS
jgi:3-hydroxyacyl-CoA dehydrogenase/enoyl-CoA hydratase/3-hydroxybutyryl-CoA epimerase